MMCSHAEHLLYTLHVCTACELCVHIACVHVVCVPIICVHVAFTPLTIHVVSAHSGQPSENQGWLWEWRGKGCQAQRCVHVLPSPASSPQILLLGCLLPQLRQPQGLGCL